MSHRYSVVVPTTFPVAVLLLLLWPAAVSFSTFPSLLFQKQQPGRTVIAQSSLAATLLRKNVELPLLDLMNDKNNDVDEDDSKMIIPLPSSRLPDQLTTPFLYGMQIETPLHKLVLEEATSMAMTSTSSSSSSALSSSSSSLLGDRPMFGYVIWKDTNSDSLVGAIGCTAEILVNAPTTEIFGDDQQIAKEILLQKEEGDEGSPSNPTPPNTVLCRGGFRFVVKEVIKTIPFPIAIVDEIDDDADQDDSDMFSSVGNSASANTDRADDEEDDDNEEDGLLTLSPPELIQRTMMAVQSVISNRLEEAVAKNNLSPLEKSILEESGLGGSINPAAIELLHAEEMTAVWEVFQSSLVDDIDASDRRFAVAIMAAELADMKNSIRQKIVLSRNSEERLRVVLKELIEIDGMAKAKKIASKITNKVDEIDKDLKVGKPQLPRWALQITKGTKVEYFWNEEYGWCTGEVIEDPITVVDEILLTIRFDDGEIHKLPLSAEDKVRWRPG